MLKSNMYLYGVDEVPEIPQTVVVQRLVLLQGELKKLLDVHWLKRDATRCNAVLKAISFWQQINDKEI